MVERLHVPRHVVGILSTFLLTSYLGLAIQCHCFGVIPYQRNIQTGLSMQVFTNTGCTVPGKYSLCKPKLTWPCQGKCTLQYSNNRLQNPLHTTTYVIISQEPIVVPPQKFYHIQSMTQLLFTKNSKNLKQLFLNY